MDTWVRLRRAAPWVLCAVSLGMLVVSNTLRWIYRVVGRDTGDEHARFILAVPWAPSDLPCRLLGLQLQITLNGVENASSGELDAYLELAQATRG